MRIPTRTPHTLVAFGVAIALAGCGPSSEVAPASTPAATPDNAPAESVEPETTSAFAWPASLVVVGDGFPNTGDACRRIGESAATVNWLDDSASLAGCPSADAAAALGGTIVGEVEGVTLVSVPNSPATAGDGDGQGDALVEGTPYHATAQVRCEGYKGAAPGFCDAGVVRGLETGTYVEVSLSDGRKRTIFFNADGSFLTFSTAEADGTAALPIESRRDGDMTIAILGTERYEVPDAFVLGG
ncbi:hypothetical protein [Silanimonas sp.]|jgi:hypothetical protein|uniref:hypothetical protein n=1 Tax=Silanimonas sp. TaxID=1929290 RepID=UPI0037C91898